MPYQLHFFLASRHLKPAKRIHFLTSLFVLTAVPYFQCYTLHLCTRTSYLAAIGPFSSILGRWSRGVKFRLSGLSGRERRSVHGHYLSMVTVSRDNQTERKAETAEEEI